MARDRRLGNLPAETTSLVGRQVELAELASLLERSRLVTLTGVGGVGKTRLAMRAAAQLRPRFPDGVWLVALSPLHDGALLGHMIGDVLGVAHQGLRSMDEELCEYLADRRLLLILDTCEHLVDMCAAMAKVLLDAAPGVRILATSRRPLEAAGEDVLVVAPLPVPDLETTAERRDDAVALLTDRAATAVPGFSVAQQDRALVEVLCRRLDGIPLAIELAAARLRDFSVDQLAERLDDRFAVLADVDHSPPPRHQTMRTAVGWSHELCEPWERLLWARLSVFAGDYDADTVVQVCADELLPSAAVVEVLLALVDKSILTSVHTGLGTRYRMLDTIRDYGAGWLRRLGEEEDLRRRHRDHFLALARQGDAEWLGPDQYAWFDRMNTEHDDLRAALDFSLDHAEGHTTLELAGALWFFWYGCGYAKEGRHFLERALAADTEPSPARNKALWACGLAAVNQGDADSAEAWADECIAAAEKHADAAAVPFALTVAVAAAAVRGDLERMAATSERVLTMRRDEFGLPVLVALIGRAHTHIAQGEPEPAITLLENIRVACEERGERSMRAFADLFRGQVELARGHYSAAQQFGRAALEVKYRLHDGFAMAMTADLLALAAIGMGQAERAARLLGLARQIWDTLGAAQANIPEWVAARKACEQQARHTIGDHAYDHAYQAGYHTDLHTGITYALHTPQTTPHQTPDNDTTS